MSIYLFENFSYNTDTRELVHAEQRCYLRKKVADVLCYLVENRDRVVGKEELLQAIWDHADYRENSLIQSIRQLRKLFGESAHQPHFIRTVHSKGYEWIYRDIKIKVAVSNITEKKVELDDKTDIQPTPHIEATKQSSINKASTELIENKNAKWAAFILLLLSSVFLLFYLEKNDESSIDNHGGVLVLPFSNDTGDENLQWLELGYSDMFSQSLRNVIPVAVVPTYIVQGTMAQQKLAKHLNNSKQISLLLTQMQSRFAIAATINKDGEDLRFNYRIHDVKGVFASGSISFTNLSTSLSSLVSQVAQRLKFVEQPIPFAIKFNNESAQQDYAKGVQALLTKGPRLAKNYFEAALINEPDNAESKIKLADSLYLLGGWDKAEQLYRQVLVANVIGDSYLRTALYNGLATLLIQKSEIVEAKALLNKGFNIVENAVMPYRKAELLRTQSKLMLLQGNTNERHKLLLQADELSQPYVNLQNEADALYYLASPANEGLEIDPEINLKHNKEKLVLALSYYQRLGNKSGEALTLLAIGQNYYFDVDARLKALKEAKKLFRQTGSLFHLIDTLSYQAFVYIQFHHGSLAVELLNEAKALEPQLNDQSRAQRINFLLAFAALDQGIDRGKGIVLEQLELAITQFIQTINNTAQQSIGSTQADSLFLLGWAYSELGQHKKALAEITKANIIYQEKGYQRSSQYALTSMMEEYLLLGQWQQVLTLANKVTSSHMSNRYTARAWYELGEFSQAANILKQSKITYKDRWNELDRQRLNIYRQSADEGDARIITAEMSSHLVYCEALWNVDNSLLIF